MQQSWLVWAQKLQAIASTGLHFGASDFDKERYAEVAAIAEAMLAALGEVPIERIRDLVPDFAHGYATPQIDVRGAVFKNDEILLVQEKSDGRWTLPGGYADVGLSAAENVVKEIAEEANIAVDATHLYAVRHKAKHAYRPDVRDFYKFFFICEPLADAQPAPGPETLAAAYFPLDALPELSTGRVIEKDLRQALAFRQDAESPTLFD